ncbi:MAG: ABC transporter ATP-binding protein [Brachymonas sp.]|nr:ABC transporter ATP-binding protein [Brachymonas sp.]
MLDISDLHTWFATPAGRVHAVNGVDLQLRAGQRLAIIGESGCGKSVLAQTLFRLLPANAHSSGRILLNGQDVLHLPEAAISALRGRAIGLIPQHLSALNPLLRIGVQLAEAINPALSLWGLRHLRHQVAEKLQQVALPASTAARFPHELSGGMCRRVLIASGTARNPGFLVADEPTTGLDRILRARIVRLLDQLTAGKTLLLITHDIEVAHFCDTLAVMYAGRIIEQGPTATVLAQPQHPYTRGLLASMPSRGMQAIAGLSPSLIDLPQGCTFHPRCPHATERCRSQCPGLSASAAQAGVLVRCHHAESLSC